MDSVKRLRQIIKDAIEVMQSNGMELYEILQVLDMEVKDYETLMGY